MTTDNFLLNADFLEVLSTSILPLLTTILYSRFTYFASISCIAIYLLFRPMNWVRDLDDVGWLTKGCRGRNRRRRKIGSLPPVYPNGWFVLAESSKVNKQSVVHVAGLGENFAIFRTESGEVKILDAYCPHMGANMAVGGKVRGECLECPFHLWQFNGNSGECIAAPTVEKVPKSAKVKRWICHESNDFIYVWYHAEGETPGWYPPKIDAIKKLTYFGRNQYQVNCHIQEIPENGSDFTHFMALHQATVLSGGDLRHHEKKWLQFYRHCWQSTWEPSPRPGEQHIGRAYLQHHITLFGKFKLGFATIDVHQAVTPTEPLLQTVLHRVYSPPHLVLYTKFFLYNECIMFERDIMIWNNKAFVEKPLFTKEDSNIAKYRRWFSQFYSEHSPTYQMAKEGVDW